MAVGVLSLGCCVPVLTPFMPPPICQLKCQAHGDVATSDQTAFVFAL